MTDQGGKAVPRFRAPTVASSARVRVSSGSADNTAGQLASRPRVTPRRVQTPHPSRRPRVASDSSSRSSESSQASQQSASRFWAPNQVPRRVPLDSSVCSDESILTEQMTPPPRTGPPAGQATADDRTASDPSSRRLAHLAGMAAAFEAAARERNPSSIPSHQRPTAASAGRSVRSGNVLKPALKSTKQPDKTPRASHRGERLARFFRKKDGPTIESSGQEKSGPTTQTPGKARRVAQAVRHTVSAATGCLVPGKKIHVDVEEDLGPQVQNPRVRWGWKDIYSIENYMVRGVHSFEEGEASGQRPLHDWVQNVYLRFSRT